MSHEPLDPATSPIADEAPPLHQVVDRQGLQDFFSSLASLAGVSLRLLGADGALLAGAGEDSPLYRYLEQFSSGRGAVSDEVQRLKRVSLAASSVPFASFTGATYRVVPIDYDQRRLGRVIIGPFGDVAHEPPPSLHLLDPDVDLGAVSALLARLPQLSPERVEALERHLHHSLGLLIFSGHKAMLTSQMHLASVSASYHELQDRNARLQQAYDRLRELDRLKSNFLATVSHELRTPLTSIIGYSEMLAEGIAGELQGEQVEFVQTIRDKGEQLLHLIKNLLDLSKLESGTLTVRRIAMPIEPVLQQVVSTLLPAARKKGVKLELSAPADLPPVLGDSERLRQVFLNLTENALKFTPANGTIQLRAELAAPETPDDEAGFALLAPTSDRLEVRVCDTGIGIPENERHKVFDAFYQVDSSSTREVGGTGLGLSIVKRLVESHEGTIHIEGNVPRGAVFVVTLPVAP